MEQMLHVTMLGSFALSYRGNTVDENSNRMRKVWTLLAYLVYSHNRRITQDNLLSVIQGAESGEVDDPAGRLKALLYRTRNLLGQLYDTAGHDLIVRKNGTYAWNPEIPMELDVEQFDALCTAALAQQDPVCRLEIYRQALPLYRGDFLPKLSMEPWVMPLNAYYHQRYLDAVADALNLLEAEKAWEECQDLCQRALKIEPYSEGLYQHLMRSRLELGDRNGVLSAYEQMSELLFDTFGVMPAEESRQLYRQASHQLSQQTLPIGMLRDNLREASAEGALYCEYDFFRFLYQAQARALVRSGDIAHIALFSLQGEDREQLPRRSLDRAMDNMQELLQMSLRRGDVFCRCSVSQFLVMLPHANYENSCGVCRRLEKAFCRQYPHSPAKVHFSVHPMEPQVP